jgi:hypothetical protein
LSNDEVGKLVDDMDKEINDIKLEALKMSWWMRGGLSYDQAMQLGVSERKLISQIISENMETTKKSGLPFF